MDDTDVTPVGLDRAVLPRLLELNARRAAEEVRSGAAVGTKGRRGSASEGS